jgi:hypothetical protein
MIEYDDALGRMSALNQKAKEISLRVSPFLRGNPLSRFASVMEKF